jgi:hypothetical protein
MRRAVSNLLLLLFTILVMLLAMEGGCRLFYDARLPQPRRAVYNGESQEWCCGPEVWGHIHNFVPNTEFKHCYDSNPNGEFDAESCVHYRLNSWGYRDVEHPREKPPGVFRIVVIGDSFTFAEGMPFEKIYPRLLAASLGLSREVEVVNLGMPGEDTEAELRTYVEVARPLRPDAVILQWNTNDFPNPAISEAHEKLIGAQYKEIFKEEKRYRWSHIVHFFWTRLRMKAVGKSLESLTVEQVQSAVEPFDALRRFRDEVEADGARLYVLIFPEIVRLDDYPYANVIQSLNAFCQAQGMKCIDLLPALARHRDRDLWAHESDHHPNSLAHRVAFEELLAFLERDLSLARSR